MVGLKPLAINQLFRYPLIAYLTYFAHHLLPLSKYVFQFAFAGLKHFLGLSDNVTYFAEQLAAHDVSVYHNRIIFKPQVIIPEVDIRGDLGELLKNRQ